MNKWIYGMISVLVILVAIVIGYYLFHKEEYQKPKRIQNELVKEEGQAKDMPFLNEISVSSVEKEKISPNAVLIMQKHYEECDHTIQEYAKIPEEFVNMTQEEVEESQEGWTVEQFTKEELILKKEIAGVCNQHYVLREKDGMIAIYQIGEDNEETLKEETGIAVEYLTIHDQIRFEEGIRIYGDEELNKTLEDYE